MTLLALALLCACSWLFGRAASARLDWDGHPAFERTAINLTVGLGLTSLLLALLGLAGHLAWGLPLVAALAGAGTLLFISEWRAAPRPPTAQPASGLVRGLSLVVLATAVVGCAGAIAPVTDDDALAYVMPIARHIANSGTVRFWADQAMSMRPLSQEVLLAFVLQVGGDRLGALSALQGLLFIGVVSALARRLTTRHDAVPLATAMAFGSPVVAFQMASSKEDLWLAALVGCAVLFAARARTTRDASMAGLCAGLAAGVKYPGAIVLAAVVAWLAMTDLRGGRIRAATAALAAGVAAGGLWYGLNLVRFGNPMAPLVFGAAGTPMDASVVREWTNGFGAPRTLLGALITPLHLFVSPELFGGRMNVLNPLLLVGLVAALRHATRGRIGAALWTSGVLYAAWYLNLQNARLLLPAAVLLAPDAASWLATRADHHRLVRAAVVVLAVAPLSVVGAVGATRAGRYLGAPDQWLLRHTEHFDSVQWMNRHLDPGRTRVASTFKEIGYLEIPVLLLDATYQTEIANVEILDESRLPAAWNRAGITHLWTDQASARTFGARLRPVYLNGTSALGGTRFFRTPPTMAVGVYEIVP